MPSYYLRVSDIRVHGSIPMHCNVESFLISYHKPCNHVINFITRFLKIGMTFNAEAKKNKNPPKDQIAGMDNTMGDVHQVIGHLSIITCE